MSQYLIGLDIGQKWCKAVMVQARHRTVQAAVLFPTPYEDEAHERIDWASLIGEINREWGMHELRRSALGITLPAEDFQVFMVEVPRMKLSEMEVAAIAEAKRRMVTPPGPDAVFQCRVIEERETPKGKFVELLVIKTEQRTIEQVMQGCRPLPGIEPKSLAPVPLSLEHVLPEPKKEPMIFVDIGAISTTMAIFHQGVLFFHRVVQFGVEDILRSLQQDLVHESIKEIEEWVFEHGVPDVDISGQDRNERLRLIEIQREERRRLKAQGETLTLDERSVRLAFESVLDRLTLEIRRTAAFYKEQSKGGRVQRFYFMGGGAKIPYFVAQINRSIGGECAVYDPLAAMPAEATASLDPKTAQTSVIWAGAWAAAWQTKAVISGAPVLDFIPQEIRKKRVWLLYRGAAALVGWAVFVVLVFMNLRMYGQVRGVEQTKKTLDQQLVANDTLIKEIERLKKEKQLFAARNQQLSMIEKRRFPTAAVLGLAAQAVPEDVVLESIELKEAGDEGYTLSLKASCECDYERAVEAALALQKALDGLPRAGSVKLVKPDLEEVLPQVDEQGRLQLTARKRREFSLQVGFRP